MVMMHHHVVMVVAHHHVMVMVMHHHVVVMHHHVMVVTGRSAGGRERERQSGDGDDGERLDHERLPIRSIRPDGAKLPLSS